MESENNCKKMLGRCFVISFASLLLSIPAEAGILKDCWSRILTVGRILTSKKPESIPLAISAKLVPVREPLSPGFTKFQFAQAMEGSVLELPDGIKFKVSVKLHRGSDELSFEITNERGFSIGEFSRKIKDGKIGEGGTYLFEVECHNKIKNAVETFLLSMVHRTLPSVREMIVRPQIDFDREEVTSLEIENKKGKRLARFYLSQGSWKMEQGGDARFEALKSEEIASTIQAAFHWTPTIEQLEKMRGIKNTAGKGITTALFARYAAIVPPGTELKLESVNVETNQMLQQVADSLRARSDFQSASRAEKEGLLLESLKTAAKDSKWGRILDKSGWEIVTVTPIPSTKDRNKTWYQFIAKRK